MATIVNCDSINRRSYPWDDLLNGKTWKLVLGEDFDKLENFRARCYQKARERGMSVTTRVAKDRKSLMMQASVKASVKANDDSTEA